MHGRRHGHPGGFNPWEMFGHMGPWGPPWKGAWRGPRGPLRGPRVRRGDVRTAILGVLADRPMNGYQIIQEIAERSRGAWKPSPGSIYPTLQQLEDEGLVQSAEHTGRRAFELTDEGRAYVANQPDDIAAPWRAFSTDASAEEDNGLEPLIAQAAAALWQIMATGSAEQQARARDVLVEMRRTLYGILADGDADDPNGG